MPEASTTIDIHYEDSKTARSIMEAISPDNLDAPEGIDVAAKVEGNILKISIHLYTYRTRRVLPSVSNSSRSV